MIKIKTLLKYILKPDYLIKGLMNPKRIVSFLKKDYIIDEEEFIISLLEEDKKEIGKYLQEIRKNKKFNEDILGKEREFRKRVSAYGDELTGGGMEKNQVFILYAIIRLLKPEIVLETGVARGVSSTYILAGLEKNKKGRLISIDLPYELGKEFTGLLIKGQDMAVIPEGKESGWLIPNNLKKRWELITGKTSDKLLPALKAVQSIDIFIHDSEHSYENMIFEYRTAWPYLKNNGILFSHDIAENSAFDEFLQEVNRKSVRRRYGFGAIKK